MLRLSAAPYRLAALSAALLWAAACGDTATAPDAGAGEDAVAADVSSLLDGSDAAPAPDAAADAIADADAAAGSDAAPGTDALADSDGTDVADATDGGADVPDAADVADVGSGKVDPCPFPTAPKAGDPGAACKTNKDCASNVCTDSSGGLICSAPCTVCCPLGFTCANVAFTGPASYACVSASTNLCAPCDSDASCQSATSPAALCVQGAGGSFCGMGCASDDTCPIGYSCVQSVGSSGSAKQCVPDSGVCGCSAKAIASGASTACTQANEFGSCKGTRACTAAGLSACSALAATAETCNGADDNCDGVTDEGFADLDKDGLADCVDPDIDGDGVANAADCSPTNAAIHPGATEICDGLDNDCDGTTDVGGPGCVVYYPDADTDTFGAADAPGVCQCAASGILTATSHSDCDDGNSAIHPGASEVCDGLDNNCDGKTDPACDGDGDGWCDAAQTTIGTPVTCPHGGGDCNDAAVAINPGATETCNGVDDDCDGVTDGAGASGCVPYFIDADGDKFGSGSSVCLCAPDGQHAATVGGDCNDLASGVHPGATEVCNGIDDNCDGQTDENGASGCTNAWADVDGDGYGDPANAACVCGSSTAFPASKAGDCDDGNAAVHPGAAEVCNGADDNCDGATDPVGATGCASYYVDADKDSYGSTATAICLCVPDGGHTASAGGDCNDADAAIHPGVTEVCNGVDDNCNGLVDEANATGCVTYWRDHDGDTYGASGDSQCLCAKSGEYTATVTGDCNDQLGGVHPGATETCNGVDDNCDGATDPTNTTGCTGWTVDSDGDGYGASGGAMFCWCAGAPGYANKAGDCNDTVASINPGRTEVCNGVDDNCDGLTDPVGSGNCTAFFHDGDGDGYGVSNLSQCACVSSGGFTATVGGDCNDGSASVHPAATEVCNGIDDNCNGQIDEGLLTQYYTDADGDGCGGTAAQLCAATSTYKVTIGGDCNDGNAAIHPGATEICNGVDDNCDGNTDEGLGGGTYYQDADGDGYGGSTTKNACIAPAGYVSLSGDCNDSNPAIHPNATEVCNGLDDNCNGQIDEGVKGTYYQDNDGDGYGNSAVTTQACSKPASYASLNGDCNDASAAVHPGASETCNGVDDNCNGQTDEGLPTQTYYLDADYDGYGNKLSTKVSCGAMFGYAANSTDCNDNNAAVHPGATEVCGNGIDDNCNGQTDEGCVACTPTVLDSINANNGWTLGTGWYYDPITFWNTAAEIAFEDYFGGGYPKSTGATAYRYFTIPNGAKFFRADVQFYNYASNGSADSTAYMTVALNGNYLQFGPTAIVPSAGTATWSLSATDWGKTYLFEVYTYTSAASTNSGGGFGVNNIRTECN